MWCIDISSVSIGEVPLRFYLAKVIKKKCWFPFRFFKCYWLRVHHINFNVIRTFFFLRFECNQVFTQLKNVIKYIFFLLRFGLLLLSHMNQIDNYIYWIEIIKKQKNIKSNEWQRREREEKKEKKNCFVVVIVDDCWWFEWNVFIVFLLMINDKKIFALHFCVKTGGRPMHEEESVLMYFKWKEIFFFCFDSIFEFKLEKANKRKVFFCKENKKEKNNQWIWYQEE